MRIANIFAAVFVLAFGGFWSSFVIVFDRLAYSQIAGQIASTHYLSTSGEITHSEVISRHGSKSSSYHPKIEYRYKVNGHTWQGERFRYSDTGSAELAWAEKVVADHPIGAQVTVYYNPKDQLDSVLSTGLDGNDLALVLFTTPFNMVMLGFFFGGFYFLRNAFRPSLAGGVKIIKDGFRTRVRLPVFTPLPLALLMTGGIAFVSIFIIVIPFGAHAPLPIVAVALVLAYGSGIAAYLMQWRKIAAGDDDLLIDEGAGTVQLPKTYKRKEQTTISFSEISAVTVELKISHGSKGDTYRYEPTLYRRSGQPDGEKLASWGSRKQAEDFADWLRRQLRLSPQGNLID